MVWLHGDPLASAASRHENDCNKAFLHLIDLYDMDGTLQDHLFLKEAMNQIIQKLHKYHNNGLQVGKAL